MNPLALKARWRLFRRILRHFRRAILFVICVVLGVVIYLTDVGLPGFLKKPLIESLHSRGVDLQFSRMRWRWYRGIVADQVHFGAAKLEMGAPQLSVEEVEIKLNRNSLWHRKLKVESLAIRNGRLIWPLTDSNLPPAQLSLTNIECQLRLLPDDSWELNNFKAVFAGLTLNLAGQISHASAIRDWSLFQGHAPSQPALLRRRLRQLADTIDQIQFDGTPQFVAFIHGDARHPDGFRASVSLDAPGAMTPWGAITAGSLRIHLTPATGAGQPCLGELKLAADMIETQWAEARRFRLNVKGSSDDFLVNPISAQMEISAETVATPWADGNSLRFSSRWSVSPTNPMPKNIQGELRLESVSSGLARAEDIKLDANFQPREGYDVIKTNKDFGPFSILQPWLLDWNCVVGKIAARDFESPGVSFAGTWRSPELVITNLHAALYQGTLEAGASLNVTNRALEFSAASDFDARQAKLLLPPNTQGWFDRQQFAWTNPPLAHLHGMLTLPAWTNRHPDWRGEVLPGLSLNGDFKCGPGSFQGIAMSSSQSAFYYSNQIFCLPDIHIVRPEGTADALFKSDGRTLDYYCKFRSDVSLADFRQMLETNTQAAFDRFNFSRPPVIDGEVWGRWHDLDRTSFKGLLEITNFSYRGETASSFKGTLAYTNRYLLITNGRLERTNGEYGAADSAWFDFNTMKGRLTNGVGRVDTMFVGRLIGPKTAEALMPYHFVEPPDVVVNGTFPLTDDITVADMRFQINGGPFEWWKFRSKHVQCVANWEGESLTLTNAAMEFYDGTLTGSATFDFSPNDSTDFLFDIRTTNSNFHALMSDVNSPTNRLEGRLNGHLHIAQASTKDNSSWFGDGDARLSDGLIWDMPIFGVVSSVLDSISPGLGNTRISEGTCTFVITNSVIRTDNLDVRSPAIRLLYNGTVGFDMKVDAKVEAEVGRSAPIVGSIVSVILLPFTKLFETHVTGTLQNPKREPVMWLTRILSPIISPVLHPWRIFNIFMPDDTTNNNTGTNQPPQAPSSKPNSP